MTDKALTSALLFTALLTPAAAHAGTSSTGRPMPVSEPTPCVMPSAVAYHLAQGQDHGPYVRKFDYDPYGQALTQIKGHYNKNTGELQWKAKYDPSHYKAETEVIGYATFTGSDQSIGYTVTTIDILGAVIEANEVEEVWLGCEVTRRTRPQGASDAEWTYEWGTFDGTIYSYSAEPTTPIWPYRGLSGEDLCMEDGYVPTVYGTLNTTDMTWAEEFSGSFYCYDWGVGEWRRGNADGWFRRDWRIYDSGSPFGGHDERSLDGTTYRRYEWYRYESSPDGEGFFATLDYAGNGTGQYFWWDYVRWPVYRRLEHFEPVTFSVSTCGEASPGYQCQARQRYFCSYAEYGFCDQIVSDDLCPDWCLGTTWWK